MHTEAVASAAEDQVGALCLTPASVTPTVMIAGPATWVGSEAGTSRGISGARPSRCLRQVPSPAWTMVTVSPSSARQCCPRPARA